MWLLDSAAPRAADQAWCSRRISRASSAGAGDGDELVELLGALDDGYERSDLRAEPKKAMAKLDAREQQVILLRFASGHTQFQVATTNRCSRMQSPGSSVARMPDSAPRSTPLVESAA